MSIISAESFKDMSSEEMQQSWQVFLEQWNTADKADHHRAAERYDEILNAIELAHMEKFGTEIL